MDSLLDMAHSEIRSLVTKAARGAGLPWGLAEEAGWAADWLSRRALPAADWAVLWLDASVTGRPGPVEFGVGLADRLPADSTTAVPDGLPGPGYLLPFLHLLALRHGPIGITAPVGPVVHVDPAGRVSFGLGWSDQSRLWVISPAPPPPESAARARVTASVIDCLEGLALRTTVPPSAASRRDAGAASPDND